MPTTYTPGCGQHLDQAIREMVALANERGVDVVATFNELPLRVSPGDDPRDVYRMRGTPKPRDVPSSTASHLKASRPHNAVPSRSHPANTKFDVLVGGLLGLNFTDQAAILHWLTAFQTAADDIDVKKPTDDILHVFHVNGYDPGVNTGDAFNADDRDNVARWIIGQALDGIRSVGSPHSVLHRFASEWLAAA